MQLDTRKKLQALQKEAIEQSKIVNNWYWIKAYEDLAKAIDVLDSFNARSKFVGDVSENDLINK